MFSRVKAFSVLIINTELGGYFIAHGTHFFWVGRGVIKLYLLSFFPNKYPYKYKSRDVVLVGDINKDVLGTDVFLSASYCIREK